MTQGSVDKPYLFLLIGIALFGFIMLASASGPLAYDKFGDSYYFVKHQFFSGVVPGIFGFLIAFFTPYTVWKKWASAMLLISIALLVLVLIPGIGSDLGTFAKSWIVLGDFSFQPAEVVKITFLIYLAAWLEKQERHLHDLHAGLVPFLAVLGVIGGLILAQPDLGTLSIIVAIAFIVYFVAGGNIVHLFGLGAAGIVALFVAIRTSSYRMERFMTFLNPSSESILGAGYQVHQAQLAIGSGGILGRGYGHSLQKFQYLPEVIGDSIFAVIGEELGFLFTVVFVVMFLCFLLRGLTVAEGARDAFGRYFAVGVVAWFGVQAFINIGSMVGVLPITGVPLPFLSYGGTSLAVSLVAAGIVLNISRSK